MVIAAGKFTGRPPSTRVATQSGNSVEQLQPMPDRRDAKLLQGLVRQARKNRLVYLILAECRLILPEAQAPQPDHDVHTGAQKLAVAHMMIHRKGRVYDSFRCRTASAPRFWVRPKFNALLRVFE